MASRKQRQLRMDFDHEPIDHRTVDNLVLELQTIYRKPDGRPWVIGFSGGKDSSAVVQLVYRALMGLPEVLRTKPVHVISSDTLVENPRVAAWLDKCLAELQRVAWDYRLPVQVIKVTPDPEESFWTCLIGKGYPAPSDSFRWCTSRLKIDPAEAHVLANIEPEGCILQLLGSRTAESKNRAASIEAHAIEGKFGTTGSLKNGLCYQPIQYWDNDNVWEYLRLFPTPWERPGDVVMITDQLTGEIVPHHNNELFDLYQDGHGGECVMEFDRRTASCGGSRFGCWTCTVIEQDKSMTNMVAFANPEFAPLLAFRDKIQAYRNDWTKRDVYGRNGRLRFCRSIPDEQGNTLCGPFITPGPYLLAVRAELLRDLFQIERDLPGFKTVTHSDIYWIKHWWAHDGGDPDLVDRIREEVLGRETA